MDSDDLDELVTEIEPSFILHINKAVTRLDGVEIAHVKKRGIYGNGPSPTSSSLLTLSRHHPCMLVPDTCSIGILCDRRKRELGLIIVNSLVTFLRSIFIALRRYVYVTHYEL